MVGCSVILFRLLDVGSLYETGVMARIEGWLLCSAVGGLEIGSLFGDR